MSLTKSRSYRSRARSNWGKFELSDPPAVPLDEEQRILRNIEKEETFIEKYQEGYPTLCNEARGRLKFYRNALNDLRKQREESEQAALTHIDSLVGDERLTISQMIDASTLPFDLDGTQASPIISGGEVRELTAHIDNSDDTEF